jgi:DNA-binding NtrC family response regulator
VQDGKIRVLVVDDEDPILRAVSRELNGHPLTLASDVDTALGALNGAQVSMVLTDYSIGDGCGIALLNEVRRRYPDIKRVLMSTERPEGLPGWINSGLVDRFVPKPFPRALVEELALEAPAAVYEGGSLV